MNRFVGPAIVVAALASAVVTGAGAQTSPAPAVPQPVATTAPRQPAPAIVLGSLSGAAPQPSSIPGAMATPDAGGSPAPFASSPSPLPSPTSPDRFHLHRPGTDVDGDHLSGNAASDIYVFRGNVVLHSDPKVDREFSGTESDDPITVTADEIDVDRFAMSYVAKGNVHFVQGDRSGRSDIAMLNEQTRNLDLLGNADVMEGDHRVRGAKMHYNFGDRRFRGSGDIRIYEPAPTPNPNASATPAPKRRRRLPL